MGNYKYWLTQLEKEKKNHGKFREKSEKVENIYMDEGDVANKFNILWSNVQVIRSALLAETPKSDVRRRFLSDNKIERESAEVIEKALSFSIDQYDFKSELDSTILDSQVTGIGITRVHYKPYFDLVEQEIGLIPKNYVNEDGEAIVRYYHENEEVDIEKVKFRSQYQDPFYIVNQEDKTYEEVSCTHIPWSKFRWQKASRWEDVNWCAIEHVMDKESLVDQFGSKQGNIIPLLYSDLGNKLKDEDDGSHALIYEIFDKRSRKYLYLSQGMDDFIETVDDPLGLENFYPFPKPLMENIKSNDLVPKPEYLFYQEQALELELVTKRIYNLTKQLRNRGIYDSHFSELSNLENAGDGDLIPVTDFKQKFPKGDIREVLFYIPIEETQRVIIGLEQRKEKIKQEIYEIIGISDIVRGVSSASETLGAQEIKRQFAGLRISTKQKRVQNYIRELLRIKAEIIAEHFDTENLSMMTGIEVTDEMHQLLKNDLLRSYKIDVETDSTVFKDAQEEQKNRIEVITAITNFMQQAFPAVQSGILPIEIAKEMVLFGIRSFKSGRQLEDAIEEIGNKSRDQPGEQPGLPESGGVSAGNGIPEGFENIIGIPGQKTNLPDGLA